MKFVLTYEFDSRADLMAHLMNTTTPNGTAIVPAMPGATGSQAAPADDDDNTPANLSAPAVDSTGLPWDERIHAKSKATNADGSWRGKRNADAATVAAVEAELRARTPSAPVSPVTANVPMPLQQPAPIQQPMQQPVQQPSIVPPMPVMDQQQPVQQFQQPIQQPAPAPVPAGPIDFNGFMLIIQKQMQITDPATGGPRVTTEYLNKISAEIAAAFQTTVNNITEIAPHPQMIQYAVQILQRDGKYN